jgi:hypothetical protein
MRSILTTLLIFSALALTTARAEDAPSKSHHVFGLGLEPHWLIIGGIGAKADFRLTDRFSLGFGGMYIPPRSNTSTDSLEVSYKWSMYEVYAGTTFMITGDYDHHGAYIFPAIGYTGASITDYSTSKLSGSVKTFELRFTGGYQWVVGKNFRFTTGAGIRVLNSSDVVVKDNQGKELLREKSGALGGLALDLHAAYLF